MQDMQDLFDGDNVDPLLVDLAAGLGLRNVRQRTGTAPGSGPNSDEEQMENEMMLGAPPSAPPSPPGSPEFEPITPPGTPPPLEGEERLPFFSMAKENLDPNTVAPAPTRPPTPLPERKPLAPLPIGGDVEVPFIEWACAEQMPNGTLKPLLNWGALPFFSDPRLDSIFSRLSIIPRADPVSMDANAVEHGPAANGVGPRTPFAQAAMDTDMTTKDAMDMFADLQNEDAAEQLHQGLYDAGLLEQLEACERCGGNPEECGGYQFCSVYCCKNTDDMGFYCERMAEPGSDRCASCAAGGNAYFTDPIAPGAMWSWELSSEEEADKVEEGYTEFLNTELATAMRLQNKMRYPAHSLQGVHFAEPALKTTIGGFSALGGRSFSFPPSTVTAVDLTKGGSLPSSPSHNLQKATEWALWGKAPDTAQEFKMASSEAAAIERAAKLAKEVKTLNEVELALNYAPGIEPRLSPISKKEGKRKMKYSGSIHLRAADNNAGARSPYAESVGVYLWLVLDGNLEAIENFFSDAELEVIVNVHAGTADFLRSLPVLSPGPEVVVYTGLSPLELRNLYHTWSTLSENAWRHIPSTRHIIFLANEDTTLEFVAARWSGLYPRQIGGPLIICQEDEYPEMWIVETASQIQRTGEVTNYALYSNPLSAVLDDGTPNPLFNLSVEFAHWQAAADAMAQLEPMMQEAAAGLANWVPDQAEVNAIREFLTPVVRQNASRGTINAAQSLRDLSVVDMVEGRSLNYASKTFRKDAAEMRSLPLATEIYEVPTTAITVVEGDRNTIGGPDNLGFKKITVAETEPAFIPHHDPINPQNSDVQVGTPFSYEDATDKFGFNTHYLEVKPPSNEVTYIMDIYDKFRKGEAEPEQVEKMLEGFHSLCSRPHRAMTWQEEYYTARDQITNLCRMNEDKDKEIKRLREEKAVVEEECRELKRQNTRLWANGPKMISQVPEEDEWQPGMLRASPTPSEMLFSRTPSPNRPARDPRSRSPPPMWG